jgi:nucleoside-diphosphate kinase
MNLVHASDSPESAARELRLYFTEQEFCEHELQLTPSLRAADEA